MAMRSEPWMIEGAEDASSRPFVAKDGDDDDDDEEEEEEDQDEGGGAFADMQQAPRGAGKRR
jgi:hypothetical protein